MQEEIGTDAVASAARALQRGLRREPGRDPSKGPHELREFAPALEDSLRRALADRGQTKAELSTQCAVSMIDWNREKSQVDLVVWGKGRIAIVAELKAWDIGHQLFDLAKICCLLKGGAASGFLLCIARRPNDFQSMPGGVLFPSAPDASFAFDFEDLIEAHLDEWRQHVGRGSPEPTAIPRRASTTAITDPVPIDAYEGHELRAAQVRILEPTPIPLVGGMPARLRE